MSKFPFMRTTFCYLSVIYCSLFLLETLLFRSLVKFQAINQTWIRVISFLLTHQLDTIPCIIFPSKLWEITWYTTHEHSLLHKEYFLALVNCTRDDLECYSVLNLSLAAHINSLKMNILPRFYYLFQFIPIHFLLSFFHKLNSLISSYMWKKMVPRIRKALLKRPKQLGGMALRIFKFYYWASKDCCIWLLKYWLEAENLQLTYNKTNQLKACFLLFTTKFTLCIHSPQTQLKLFGPMIWGLRFWVKFGAMFLTFTNLQCGLNTASSTAKLSITPILQKPR